MWFVTVILKNLLRRKVRSLLTVVGISIGVAAVVSMTAIAWGFEKSWTRAYTTRGTDLAITKTSSKSPMPAPFDVAILKELRKLPGVKSTSSLLSDFVGVEESPGMLLFGWEQGSFLWEHLKLIEGRWPMEGEKAVVLGTVSAELLQKQPGSIVQIDVGEYSVCGIFESSAMIENGAVIMMLGEMQKLTDNPDRVNFVNLRLEPGVTDEDIGRLKAVIKKQFPGFNAFKASELASHNTGIQVTRAMGWATSVIALVVGAIGMMNTLFMSVFERMHEIGILLAIGWQRARILRMILLESLALSAVGGVVGSVLGFLVVRGLEGTSMLRGKLEGDLSPKLFGMALLIALGLGVLGGLYPAWRGSRMAPSRALRYD